MAGIAVPHTCIYCWIIITGIWLANVYTAVKCYVQQTACTFAFTNQSQGVTTFLWVIKSHIIDLLGYKVHLLHRPIKLT